MNKQDTESSNVSEATAEYYNLLNEKVTSEEIDNILLDLLSEKVTSDEAYNILLGLLKEKSTFDDKYNCLLGLLKEKVISEGIYSVLSDLYQEKVLSDLLNEKVTSEDIYYVFDIINNDQNVGEAIIQLENKLLINSFCKEKKLFSSRFIYYSVASVIMNVGVFTNNLKQIEMIFKKIMKIINIIFDDKKLSYKQKMKLFNTSCLKCEKVCHQIMDSSEKNIENEASRIIDITYRSLNDYRISNLENNGCQKIKDGKERKIS